MGKIAAEELAVYYKLNFKDRALLFSPDLTTKEYQDLLRSTEGENDENT